MRYNQYFETRQDMLIFVLVVVASIGWYFWVFYVTGWFDWILDQVFKIIYLVK